MNKLPFVLYCFLCVFVSAAQVGIGTNTPDAAAVLDINSEVTTGVYGGLKLPTVTLTQRATIATPIPDGLMIYLSEGTTRCVQIYDGNLSSWMNFYCMNNVPEATIVSTSGTFEVEEILNGTYTYNDAEGDLEATSTFQWYRADDAAGTNATAIAGATATTFTLTSAEAGFYIAYEVTPLAATGATTGSPVRSSYTLVNYKDVDVNFNQQNQIIAENSVNDDVQLSFTLSNTNYAAITLTVTASDYSRLDENTAATIVIPANATSPYLTTIAPFNIDDNSIIDGTANVTFTITGISGGSGTTTLGATTTDTLQINDDDSLPSHLISEDFETNGNGTRYNTSRTEAIAANMSDYFSRTDGTDISAIINNEDGFYFAAQDIDGLGGSQAQQLTFNSVLVSGTTVFNYSIDLAEDDDGTNQDWDAGEYFRIQYRLDGTGAWSTAFEVSAPATNSEPRVTQNSGGTVIGTSITDTFQTFSGSFTAAPVADIEFRLTFSLDAGDEDIAADNFIVN